MRTGAVGGWLCRHNARSLDARIRLLASQRSLTAPRRPARGLRLCFLGLAFVIAAQSAGLHAQAPALSETVSCHGTQQVRQVAELLFGRDVGNRLAVSESAWTRFVGREITSRFPDGFTVSDAAGQWRDRRGEIIREPAKRVEIVLPGASDDQARLDAVIAAYKRAFHQRSVVVIVRPACVSF